jgi:hypothetical protein
LSPEYATLGQLSEKVDVFSYGVLLLEIVSGRKNIDLSLETNKIYLLEWVSVCTFSFKKNQVKLIIEFNIVGPRCQFNSPIGFNGYLLNST